MRRLPTATTRPAHPHILLGKAAGRATRRRQRTGASPRRTPALAEGRPRSARTAPWRPTPRPGRAAPRPSTCGADSLVAESWRRTPSGRRPQVPSWASSARATRTSPARAGEPVHSERLWRSSKRQQTTVYRVAGCRHRYGALFSRDSGNCSASRRHTPKCTLRGGLSTDEPPHLVVQAPCF